MKKHTVKMLSLALALVMLFTLMGCGKQETPDNSTNPNESTDDAHTPKAYTISMVTGSTGGSWYAAGAAYSEVIKEYLPGSNVIVNVGGGVSNPSLVSSGQADIGFTYSPALIAALNGTGAFPEPLTNIRAFARLEPCYGMAFATKDSGITSFEQIKEEKIPVRLAVPAVGNFGESVAASLLEAYGLSYDMIESFGGSVQHVSHPEAADLFRDNHIDMYIAAVGLGHATVTEMCLSRDMVFLPCTGDAMKYMETLGYGDSAIPAGSFNGMTEDVPAVVYSAIYLVRDDADENMVYFLTKALYENKDALAAAYSAINEANLDEMADCFGAPLHPGAEAFYKEVGLL